MKTRVFILCAGKDVKHFGTTRQLLKIDGEEILRRTIRLITQECNYEIFIVTRNSIIENNLKDIIDNKVIIFHPAGERYHMESLYSTKEKWVDRNIFLFGDVVFSEFAIKKILSLNNKIRFIFRIKPHLYLNKSYPEMFGILIPMSEAERMCNIILRSYEGAKKKGGDFIFQSIWEDFDLRLGKKRFEYFKSYKTREIISKLCLNNLIRSFAYKLIRPFEGKIMRFIFYKAKLTEKRKKQLSKVFLGKNIPDFNKKLLSSKYVVEIHDTTDDIDGARQYKDYIKLIVKKKLLK